MQCSIEDLTSKYVLEDNNHNIKYTIIMQNLCKFKALDYILNYNQILKEYAAR